MEMYKVSYLKVINGETGEKTIEAQSERGAKMLFISWITGFGAEFDDFRILSVTPISQPALIA